MTTETIEIDPRAAAGEYKVLSEFYRNRTLILANEALFHSEAADRFKARVAELEAQLQEAQDEIREWVELAGGE